MQSDSNLLETSQPFMCFKILSSSITADFSLFASVFFLTLFSFLSLVICFCLRELVEIFVVADVLMSKNETIYGHINIAAFCSYYLNGFMMLLCCWYAFCFLFTKYVFVPCINMILLTGRDCCQYSSKVDLLMNWLVLFIIIIFLISNFKDFHSTIPDSSNGGIYFESHHWCRLNVSTL